MNLPALLLAFALAPALNSPDPVFTVEDPRIGENSGMVDLGSLTVVTNDSGDTGRVFALDGAGRTVGVTRFGDSVDAEALAPAGGGPGVEQVWVGDIGDNDLSRAFVTVRRVPVGRGDRTVRVPSYRLVYPDGPRNAETLLRQPRTGRLYVVTKGILGGTVYAAPARLSADRPNRLTEVAGVSIFATDGAFLGDGRHVLVRGYGDANLYSFPDFQLLGTFALPSEPQGEALSVGPGDRLRIGSEGEREPVLAVTLPSVLAGLAGAGPAVQAARATVLAGT